MRSDLRALILGKYCKSWRQKVRNVAKLVVVHTGPRNMSCDLWIGKFHNFLIKSIKYESFSDVICLQKTNYLNYTRLWCQIHKVKFDC